MTAVIAALAVILAASAASGAAAGATFRPPAIKHVWVIMLENESAGYTFSAAGRSQAPYLTRTLPAMGALLTNYYATGHASADNYVAMVSGQAGNLPLNADCANYSAFHAIASRSFGTWTEYGQLAGEGCVFPADVPTLAGQLDSHGDSWREYAQDMGIDARRDGTVMTKLGPACGHPPLGGSDPTDSSSPANDSYATRHNPFMYFQSIIGARTLCDTHVLSLAPLAPDLQRAAATPSYSFITPNTCNDGHDWPTCHDGTPGRLPRVDAFLKQWIPRIIGSPAYRSGLIIISFDESGLVGDAGACCGEVDSVGYGDPSHPNINEPGLYGPGGGRVGAVLLSPFIRPGTISTRDYNHYSQLRSIEDIFGLPHLGDARQPQVQSFGPDVYTRAAG